MKARVLGAVCFTLVYLTGFTIVSGQGQEKDETKTLSLESFTGVFLDESSTTIQKDTFVGKLYQGIVEVSDVLNGERLRVVVQPTYRRTLLFYTTERDKVSRLRKGDRIHVVATLKNIFETRYTDGKRETAEFTDSKIEKITSNKKK